MIMSNENKTLSPNRKRKIFRKIKFRNAIDNNFHKVEKIEIELVKKYANNPKKLQTKLRVKKKFKLLTKNYMRINKKYYENVLVNLKWLDHYFLDIILDRHILDSDRPLVMNII